MNRSLAHGDDVEVLEDEGHIGAYRFTLPDENIARFPAAERAQSKLLVLPKDAGAWPHPAAAVSRP